ncbi:MAG: hypothetical protein M1834_000599 [Cirrosporium novae-zelandiae]|nr:MAG: hypothetical protein M1834_000599 [Cirrosporium novae-zelandiae]
MIHYWPLNSEGNTSVKQGSTTSTNTKKKTAPTTTKKDQYAAIKSKGKTVAGGVTGLVERLPCGDVVKSPWPGDEREAECRRDMAIEAQIYQRLGPHPRLVKVIDWDPETCVLTMEYMPNGSLKDFLHAHNDDISMPQRLQWIRQAAEGLQLLHSAGVIHCDIGPRNFLLDAALDLKIADFSGSSLDGSSASVCAGTRFSLPDFSWNDPPTVRQDLFGLGSTIYCIMTRTGQCPFGDLPSNQVEKLYAASEFPDVSEIVIGMPRVGEIIKRCWRCEVGSAKEVYDYIQQVLESNK